MHQSQSLFRPTTPNQPTAVDPSEQSPALAVIAIGEALNNPRLDQHLLERLLVDALKNNLRRHGGLDSDAGIQASAEQLLTQAKITLPMLYESVRHELSDFDQIARSAREQTDYDFLAGVANSFARHFIGREDTRGLVTAM